MASITATRSPACTFWPGCTGHVDQQAGHRRQHVRLMSGGALKGISRMQLGHAWRHHQGLDLGAVVLHAQGQRVLGRAALHLGRERLAIALCPRCRYRSGGTADDSCVQLALHITDGGRPALPVNRRRAPAHTGALGMSIDHHHDGVVAPPSRRAGKWP
jgi:hypothetical protein